MNTGSSCLKLNAKKSFIVLGLTILLEDFPVQEVLEEGTSQKGKLEIVLCYKGGMISLLFIATILWRIAV